MTVWGDYAPEEQALFLSLMESAGVCFVRRKADPKAGPGSRIRGAGSAARQGRGRRPTVGTVD